MASTTPTAHFFVEWAPVYLYSPVFGLFVHFVRTISAKDFSIMEEIFVKPHLLSQLKAVGL